MKFSVQSLKVEKSKQNAQNLFNQIALDTEYLMEISKR